MKTEEPGKLLRIFIGESDRCGYQPLYTAIVEAAIPAGHREARRAFLPTLDEMVKEGLVTLETVEVIAYRAGAPKGR